MGFYDVFYKNMKEVIDNYMASEENETRKKYLKLLPDMYLLLQNLYHGHFTLPAEVRDTIGNAMIYLISPIDLIPEEIYGASGYFDDLIIVALAIEKIIEADEKLVSKIWEEINDTTLEQISVIIKDILSNSNLFVEKEIYDKLKAKLK